MKRFFSVLVISVIMFAGLVSWEMPSKGELVVNVTGFENSNGKAFLHLYNSQRKNDFPLKPENAYDRKIVLIKDNKTRVIFSNLPFGEYALTVHHDENSNELMDKNFLGLPAEGYGFSQNPLIITSPPDFDESKIRLNSKRKTITVEMKD